MSLRADLVQRARALGLNLSSVVEGALEDAIRQAEQRAWMEANRDAIADYNEQVRHRGLFSDVWRRF